MSERLDLSGIPCPQNAARAIIRLEGMDPGAMIEIIIDDGEPYTNVPAALRTEGHRIVHEERLDDRWLLRVERN